MAANGSKLNRRQFLSRTSLTTAGFLILPSGWAGETSSPTAVTRRSVAAVEVARRFAVPPEECGPWVYWFWLDVNVTRAGITADLEAMKAVGIVGVLIMDVDQGTPASFNGAQFGDSHWYELFAFACAEAKRLGLRVNMTNDAGWCGSGGPWVTPELSMQRVVWSRTVLTGEKRFTGVLAQPKAQLGFYRDIAVLAYPTPADHYRLGNLQKQTDEESQYDIAAPAQWPALKPGEAVAVRHVHDLSGHMDRSGRLTWKVPAGRWTVLRLGHTSTGVKNHPAPAGGLGLETDKLSRRATQFQFDALMQRILDKIGPLAGHTLVATHIDSWETGSQNWTATFRADFQRLRGYDLLRYLPVFTGQAMESQEVSERFLWDLRQTIGDLLVENYAAAMRQAAAAHGLRLSIEGYSGEPAGDLLYGGQANEPMSECWSWGRFGAKESVTEMTSAGHVAGRPIIGQETFTADAHERWLGHPAVVKDIGDWTFCEGVNRFVFHRYAMQPWTNPHYAPGVSMGPWGLHYERTETWWPFSRPWHEYVARCQYLLRQGNFVADVCYVLAEGMPRRFSPPDNGPGVPPRRPGYNYDGCPPEWVLHQMEFKDGLLQLPGGMAYRVLVLPDSPTMTPALLRKIKKLVEAGATVIGPQPKKSPSLSGYPHCDEEVARLTRELWGAGRISTGKTAAQALAEMGIKPDFQCDQPMVRWTHRRAGDLDIYFVANGQVSQEYPYAGKPMVAHCVFRVAEGLPEFWDPETGRISPVGMYDCVDGQTRMPIVLPPKGSVFVVFRHDQSPQLDKTLRSVSRDGRVILATHAPEKIPIQILSARYGVPGVPQHTRDATAIVQGLVNEGQTVFPVVKIAALGGDPDYGVVKTLDIRYRRQGQVGRLIAHDGQMVDLAMSAAAIPPVSMEAGQTGALQMVTTQSGHYRCRFASGKTCSWTAPRMPAPITLRGPWRVNFPIGWGAPDRIQLEELIAWNQHPDAGVRHFSGTAGYECGFELPNDWLAADRRIDLDLGKVAVMAQVTLNGRDCGILWKPPYRFGATDALKAGHNRLTVRVANLWVNRLIGDEQLPEDSDRAPDGHLLKWPQWLLDGQPSPTGRLTFTTWRLWHKNDALVESGLMGPVRLQCAALTALRPGIL